MRVWQLPIALDAESDLPLYLQISGTIAAAIRTRRLSPGDALPGSRSLARSVGVHRNTVLAAYTELMAEGWVTTRGSSGTFVSHDLPATAGVERPKASAGAGFDIGPPLPYERPPSYRPGALVLAKGAPDVRLLPTVELARAYRRVLGRDGRALLTYGDPAGHPRLRAALAEMLSTARGVVTGSDGILVTRGSQMALDLIARSMIGPGEVVVVEALGHPQVWNAFRLAGAELLPVPVGVGGLQVDAVAEIARHRRVRAVYVTPHHQFPTTTVMPAASRLQLLDLAQAHGFAVIEDDYDHEFHYDGRPVLPLASSDRGGVVIYVGTLSKILAPGLRIGFVAAPPSVIERMTSVRVAADLQGDLALECAVAELFTTGELGRHVRRMRRTYRSRRDALVSALRGELAGWLEVTVPSGGMALWARAAPEVNVDAWARRASAYGVEFRGGRMYDFGGGYQPFARLGFTYHDERELAEAARRMARSLEPTSGRAANRRRPTSP